MIESHVRMEQLVASQVTDLMLDCKSVVLHHPLLLDALISKSCIALDSLMPYIESTQDEAVVKKAVRRFCSSQLVVIDEENAEGSLIRLIEPLDSNAITRLENRVLYVERLQSNLTLDAIQSQLQQQFGSIECIAVPRYPSQKKNSNESQFAFVVFEQQQVAQRVFEHFQSTWMSLTSQTSVVSYIDHCEKNQMAIRVLTK